MAGKCLASPLGAPEPWPPAPPPVAPPAVPTLEPPAPEAPDPAVAGEMPVPNRFEEPVPALEPPPPPVAPPLLLPPPPVVLPKPPPPWWPEPPPPWLRALSSGTWYSTPAGLCGSTVKPGSAAEAPAGMPPVTATAPTASAVIFRRTGISQPQPGDGVRVASPPRANDAGEGAGAERGR